MTPEGYVAHLGPQSQVTDRESTEYRPRVLLLLVCVCSGRGQGFTGSLVIGELETEEWKLKHRKGKTNGQTVTYLSPQEICKRKETSEWDGLALY